MKFDNIKSIDFQALKNLQPPTWSDMMPDFEFYVKSSFCHPIKAEINDEIVGIGTSIIFENTSWLAHIIVDSHFRNRGIGFQIVKELLAETERQSIQTCTLIATEQGKPIYEKAGFRPIAEYLYLKREKPWQKTSIAENIISFGEKYRSMIYDLDEKISGEKRERLLTNYIESSLIYVEKNKVLGYYMPDAKEGVIFADTSQAGLELMKLKYSSIDKAVLPSENLIALDFLKQNGFVETGFKGTRMVIGKNIDWKPQKVYSWMGGNFG